MLARYVWPRRSRSESTESMVRTEISVPAGMRSPPYCVLPAERGGSGGGGGGAGGAGALADGAGATGGGAPSNFKLSMSTRSYVFTWLPVENRTEWESPLTNLPLMVEPLRNSNVSAGKAEAIARQQISKRFVMSARLF